MGTRLQSSGCKYGTILMEKTAVRRKKRCKSTAQVSRYFQFSIKGPPEKNTQLLLHINYLMDFSPFQRVLKVPSLVKNIKFLKTQVWRQILALPLICGVKNVLRPP